MLNIYRKICLFIAPVVALIAAPGHGYRAARNAKSAVLSILLLGVSAPALSNTEVHDVRFEDTEQLLLTASHISNSDNQRTNTGYSIETVTFKLLSSNKELVLHVQPSRLNTLAQKYSSLSETTALFEGVVEGDKDSWVRISVANDGAASNSTLNQQFNGHVFHNGELFQLETKDYLANLGVEHEGTSDHVLFLPGSSAQGLDLLRGYLPPQDNVAFAPVNPFQTNATNDTTLTDLLKQRKASITASNNVNASLLTKADTNIPVTRVLRVGIFIDSLFNETHDNRGVARALSIMSGVDAIYQSQLGVAVIVENVSFHGNPNTDPMRKNGGQVSDILNAFRQVRLEDKNLPNDLSLVHLFTGHRDPNRVIGLGWKDTTCRLDGFDISVSTPFPFDTLLAAHELAHNLGSVHDGDLACSVESNSQQNTLMWPAISGDTLAEFSSCSKLLMADAKNANCNLDNIDAAIDIRTYATSESLRRSVIIEASNNDQHGRATELYSTTQFPAGTAFESLSAGCIVIESRVECNHGTVRANASSTVAMAATVPNALSENVVTTVELLNAADINTIDNRRAILMLQSIVISAQAVASDTLVLQDVGNGETDDFVTGIGAPSSWLLFGLWMLVLRRPTSKPVKN